jgi:Protein of unknown function (DUF3738)
MTVNLYFAPGWRPIGHVHNQVANQPLLRRRLDDPVAADDVLRFRGLTVDQVREMLRPVLADRFKLSVHNQMKELSVYELVVSKNGPKARQW